jgi:hypothetical protein
VQDQPSTCDDNGEPRPRPKTIPDDFIWDPEEQAWYPPGEPTAWDAEGWRRKFDEAIRHAKNKEDSGDLISYREFLAARALEVPPASRKLRRTKRVERGQLSLFGDDGTLPTKQPPTPSDPDGDVSAEEPS